MIGVSFNLPQTNWLSFHRIPCLFVLPSTDLKRVGTL